MSDEIIRVGNPLPRIAFADVIERRIVRIIWKTGSVSVVDLAPALLSRRIYIPLRNDDDLFGRMRVDEYGTALEWPGGLEFSALWLSELPAIQFDNDEFRRSMDALGMSLEGMAAALEISRRQVADYRKDKHIPRSIAYAVRYLSNSYNSGDHKPEKVNNDSSPNEYNLFDDKKIQNI